MNREEMQTYFHELDGQILEVDRLGLEQAYIDSSTRRSSIAIKILTIIGGILASIAFLGFVGIFDIFQSPNALLFTGVFFMVASFVLNAYFKNLLLDTLSVTTYIIALVFITLALDRLHVGGTIIASFLILAGLLTIYLTSKYILTFIALLTFHVGSCIFLFDNEFYEIYSLYLVVCMVFTAALFLFEPEIIVRKYRVLENFDVLRIGSVFVLLIGLTILSIGDWSDLSPIWLVIPSIVAVLLIYYFLVRLTKGIDGQKAVQRSLLFVLMFFIFLPTVYSPGIVTSLLLILLCFYVNYNTGFVISVISLVCFLFEYYYDLKFTLMTKSILLTVSGLFFLVMYFLINKVFLTDSET